MKENQYSSPVFSATVHDSMHSALLLMKTNFIKRIVVVKDKKPVGILTERDISRFLEKDNTKRSLSEIPVKEVMKKNLITVVADQQDFLHQCATRMVTFKIGSIVVTDEEGSLVGITTQTDITKAFRDTYAGRYKVGDYMSRNAVTCRNSDYLKYALAILNRNNVSRLVVTDNNGHVNGVITTNTFLTHTEYFKRSDDESRDYLLTKNLSSTRVENLIKNEILTVEADDDLANAAHLMIKNKISGIPVTVRDSLDGVVTKFDIVRAFNDAVLHKEVLERYRLPR
jgi:predicted transcriptional regulator